MMPDRIDKINRLNFGLYMHNRTKSYDFTKSKEIRECFKMSLCAFFDYGRYHREVKQTEDTFEASIEFHDPVTWMSVTGDTTSGDGLVIKTMKSMTETAELFNRLKEREEKVCKALLYRILNMGPDIRTYVLGDMFENPVYNKFEFVSQVYNYIEIPDDVIDSEEAYMLFIDYISEIL